MDTTNAFNNLSRVGAFFTIVAIALLVLLATGVRAGSNTGATGTYIVGQGDTLWDIAVAHTASGDDVRETLFRIEQANSLTSAVIAAGQVVRVPFP